MSTYRFADEIIEKNTPDWQAMLAESYRTKLRPYCLCRPTGIPMYVIYHEHQYYIKRMPNMGQDHAPTCPSFEPPAELSGLGEVLGTAIVGSDAQQCIQLKLEFALNKRGARTIPEGEPKTHDSAQSSGGRLSLRALLHYLWEQAGFQRWTPAMRGKRHWSIIRHHLRIALKNKESKGIHLAEILYIPEAFSVTEKAAIASRRANFIASALQVSSPTKSRKLALLIAEVKEFVPARYGHKMIAKNLPDYPFGLDHELYKRITRRFNAELSLWDHVHGAHLIAIATFGVNEVGVSHIDELSLMVTTDAWLPIDNLHEKLVLDRLIEDERRFFKGLRYNLSAEQSLATAVLVDTTPPTALFINVHEGDAAENTVLSDLISTSKLSHWIWSPQQEDMPALPPPI